MKRANQSKLYELFIELFTGALETVTNNLFYLFILKMRLIGYTPTYI